MTQRAWFGLAGLTIGLAVIFLLKDAINVAWYYASTAGVIVNWLIVWLGVWANTQNSN